jgi:hypothetical protein
MNERNLPVSTIDQRIIRRKPLLLVIDRYKGMAECVERTVGNVCDLPERQPVESLGQAVSLFYRYRPDIVVCEKAFDFAIPEPSRELLVKVKRHNPNAKMIIHSTVVGDEEQGKDGFSFDAVILKGDVLGFKEAVRFLITQIQNKTQF